MTYPRTIAAWSGYAAVDGATGYRHHAVTTADVYRARAAALRSDARYCTGIARARLLSRAESCERMAGALQRTEPAREPITTLSRHGALVEVP